jgi:Flp pilus assembly pilin Flp
LQYIFVKILWDYAPTKAESQKGVGEMKGLLGRFLRDEAAAASIEYALLMALVALAVVLSIQGLGSALDDTVNTAADELEGTERCVEVGSKCKK